MVQCDFLLKLGQHLGRPEADAWATRRNATRESLLVELWSEEKQQFLFKDATTGKTWASRTLLKYIPLIAAEHLPSSVILALELGLEKHLTEWGLATEELESPLYEPDGYWRGPIWAPATILIESGLRVAGRDATADSIASRYIRLCADHGFAENYNAKTGVGNRDLSYTWSASTYLVLRRELSHRQSM